MLSTRIRTVGVAALGATLLSMALPSPSEARQGPRPGPIGGVGRDRDEAREVFRALRRRAEADRARLRAEGDAVDRPEKVVSPPSLTPADLDALIARSFGGADPAPIADDATFLRRVSLDLAGSPPTVDQVRLFEADDDPEKRSKLIDRLLASNAFAASRARYWRDVIRYRATFENPRLIDYGRLEGWLAEQFRDDRPWDEVAADLIAATGPTSEAGNVGFAVAHLDGRRSVNPSEFAGEVSRIFLGVQIQCAECHDHPTDPWTRRQFHEFAAFFAGTDARRLGRPQDPDYQIEIVASPRIPRHGMPDLADPSRMIPVTPKFFLDASADPLPGGLTAQQRRELAASYVTGQDNPWFSRAFVNRAWADLMGDAFYLPVDDLGPNRSPIAPEVIDALADQWRRGGHDVKWLYRTILNTDAYQRRSASSETLAGQAPFSSNCPGRLRADQIAEALDRALGLFSAAPRLAAARGPEAMRRARFGPRFFIDQLFGVDPSTPVDEVLGTIPQALFLMNAPQLEQAIAHPRGTLSRILAEHPGDGEALEALYLRVLSRAPTEDEAALCRGHLAAVGDRREAFEDLTWSLINSVEFISRR